MILSLVIGKYLFDGVTNLAIITPLWMEFALVSFALVLLLVCAALFARLTYVITRAQREFLPTIDPSTLPAPVAERRSVVLVSNAAAAPE